MGEFCGSIERWAGLMQRYFVEELTLNIGDIIRLNSDDSHHLIRVMRARQGMEIFVVTQEKDVFIAAFQQAGPDGLAEVKIIAEHPQKVELPVSVTIACGLSKNDKIDLIVQKTTECGMAAFIPLALERDVVQWTSAKSINKQERLAKIAKEAAEQSHRQFIPAIQDLMNLKQLMSIRNDYDVCLVAYEEDARSIEHSQLRQVFNELEAGQKILIVFGSEGGISPNEIDQLKENGFISCSLGPRILRAETAPIYFLSALSYKMELENTF